MSSSLTCEQCNAKLKLKAGKTTFRGKCPRCSARIDWTAPAEITPDEVEDGFLAALEEFAVPARQQLPEPVQTRKKSKDSSADVLRRLLAGFHGTIPRRGPGVGYRLALLFTALAVCCLIVLYFALIAGAGYGVYWYATNILPTGLGFRGRITGLILAFHGAVVFAGGALVWSLVRPLFSRDDSEHGGRVVTLRDAPVLHSFVSRIAESLGSPVPSEIRLTYDVNASASYSGFFGLLRKQLVLSIGAPLITGLDTRQLAGIIAHELGHFSQRGGMFLRHFVLNFYVWCLKASGMQSDLADQVMDDSHTDSSVEMVFRFVFWATQSIGSLVIKGLAMVGLLVTMFVSRRQEFDADRYEAELVGSDAFFGTVRRLIELSIGQKEIIRRGPSYVLEVLFQPNGMENFSAEVVAAADAKAERSIKQIEKALQAPTRWFDSHPSDFDRITAARAKSYPGIFQLSLPAWHLYPRLNPEPE